MHCMYCLEFTVRQSWKNISFEILLRNSHTKLGVFSRFQIYILSPVLLFHSNKSGFIKLDWSIFSSVESNI